MTLQFLNNTLENSNNTNLCEKYRDIIIDRQGIEPQSNMTTIDVINQIEPHIKYKIDRFNLIEINEKAYTNQCANSLDADTDIDYTDDKNIENSKYQLKHSDIKSITISNNWNLDITEFTLKSNILGGSGSLIIDKNEIGSNKLKIPVADINHIGYYDCKLLKFGDTVSFDTDAELPLCVMNIGPGYIKNYIYQKAGGVYLEYHDRPHFHMPSDDKASGYLILGKKICDNTKLTLSAFKIPYGYAVYMNKYVIHNDCFLIGDYLVVYSKTDNYSTVLLKDKFDNSFDVTVEDQL